MKWTKSSKCDDGTCVEVALDGIGTMIDSVAVRNSAIPGEVAWFTPEEWAVFTAAAKAGEFETP